ncbi:dTDP-4-dehydrorhamnose 3,5-epimerase family protein [Variovorax boronicumulans]|uniref:dTDP-4-dehydrorhamnose 3,5-epimerase family protein n=1 Tax=Variovorax boronicumulans TaxID=436515 RepID=UPI0033979362
MPKFSITETALEGVKVVQRYRIEDVRGFFSRFFCAEELAVAGFDQPVAQMNQTLTRRRGSLRGLHFQHPPHAEDKFVSCVRGEVFDVALDLRRNSPTFLRWHAETLSGDNGRSLLIPKGFAHGFQTLCDDVELLYVHSAPYVQGAEGGVNPTDPLLRIAWPLPFADLSDRDAARPLLTPDFVGI